jgi:type 1 glutamine amidotransferase
MKKAFPLYCWLCALVALLLAAGLAPAEDKKKIVFIAGNPSHGFGAHDHQAGCMLLAKCLNESGLPVTTEVVTRGWPKDESVLDGADCIIIYADGGGGHPANAHLPTIDKLAGNGVGIVCVHYGVEVPKGEPGDRFLDWIGGYFETHYSVNPHWTAKFTKFPDHPIARGVGPFDINDEWYYHMRFRPEMKNVTPILTDLPPKETLSRGDGPHSDDGGRGFGFTGGHVHWNWGNDDFRKLVLNAIVWCAKFDVPEEGVPAGKVTAEDLLTNHDEAVPQNFDKEGLQKRLDDWNK